MRGAFWGWALVLHMKISFLLLTVLTCIFDISLALSLTRAHIESFARNPNFTLYIHSHTTGDVFLSQGSHETITRKC